GLLNLTKKNCRLLVLCRCFMRPTGDLRPPCYPIPPSGFGKAVRCPANRFYAGSPKCVRRLQPAKVLGSPTEIEVDLIGAISGIRPSPISAQSFTAWVPRGQQVPRPGLRSGQNTRGAQPKN